MQVAEGVCKHLKEAFRRRYADSAGGNAAADRLFAFLGVQGQAQPRDCEATWPSGGIFAPKSSGDEELTVARLLPVLIVAALARPHRDHDDLWTVAGEGVPRPVNHVFRTSQASREVLLQALRHYSTLFRIAGVFGLQEITEADLEQYTADVAALTSELSANWPRETPKPPWDQIPKFHAMTHLPHFVRLYGRPSNSTHR